MSDPLVITESIPGFFEKKKKNKVIHKAELAETS